MDALSDMEFEGGIDTLDLSSVGNAEEVGASTLLSPMKPMPLYGTSTRGGIQPMKENSSHGQSGNCAHKPCNASDVTELHVRKSPENVDMGMDFDVDCFLNTGQRSPDGLDKVSTVIHYVPANEISCHPSDDGEGELSDSTAGHDSTSVECIHHIKYPDGQSKYLPQEISTQVISVNSTALHKQNAMTKNILNLNSVTKNVTQFKTISSKLSKKLFSAKHHHKSTSDHNDLHSGGTRYSNPVGGTQSNGTNTQSTSVATTANKGAVTVNNVQNLSECMGNIKDDLSSISTDNDQRGSKQTAPNLNIHNTGQGATHVVEYNIHVDNTQKIKDEDGNTKWSCNICSGTYSSRHNLVTHILRHNNIRPHYCLLCGKMFRQISHLQTHLLTHGNTRPHVCHICSRAFTQLSHLKRHRITHQDSQTIVCRFCGRGFAYTSELKAHEAKHEQAQALSCNDCGLSFDTNRKLKHHIAASHSKSKDLFCTECNKGFNYPSQLRDHMLKHSGNRPYSCDKCDMRFMKEHHLRAHQVTHSGVRPYSCPTCSRSFNQQGNLQRHMLIHSQEKQFRCKICDKAFAQQQVLNTHLLTHSTEKPHKCAVCGKGFTRAHNLRAHSSIHKDKKPHVCLCGASFTVKGNLNRHRKQYHGLRGKISMEEEAAFILKSMSTQTQGKKSKSEPDTNDSNNGAPNNVGVKIEN